jgi:hypothetical protein
VLAELTTELEGKSAKIFDITLTCQDSRGKSRGKNWVNYVSEISQALKDIPCVLIDRTEIAKQWLRGTGKGRGQWGWKEDGLGIQG